ncbi:MAG TPA: type II secretion system F family protein [Actinomycetota bacterium]|nr:type II secretion system F family protein [Actinomycetota bacterium]
MTWLLAVAYLGAAVLLVAGLAGEVDPRIAERLRDLAVPDAGTRAGTLERLGRLVPSGRARRLVGERLAAAGDRGRSVDEVLGRQVALAGAAVGLGLAAAPSGGPGLAAVTVILAVAAFRWPAFALARRASLRRSAAAGAVPDLLDLVAVSVTAGLTPRLALERAADWVPGPLAEHLMAARRDVALGQPWRQAIRTAAERSGLRDLRRLAVALERSSQLGSPLARELRALAAQVRAERRAAAEERARRAPVAMLFPLVFLILPAFVLAVVVPTILVAVRGLE